MLFRRKKSDADRPLEHEGDDARHVAVERLTRYAAEDEARAAASLRAITDAEISGALGHLRSAHSAEPDRPHAP